MNFNKIKKYTGIAFSSKIENLLSDCSQLIIRLGFSALLLTHGWPKLINFSQKAESFPDPIGLGSQVTLALAVLAEFVAALFIALGLFTRISALGVVVTMAIIVFVFHGDDPFSHKELALLYCFAFSSIMVAGSPRWSLDNFLNRRFK